MATFTVELRSILDRNIPIWDTERPYPIYDEAYRAVLNRRIEDHYRYHEIGFETIDQFIDRLNHKMRLNMPALNKFYESTFMEFDPMVTQRFVRDELSTLTGEDSGTVGTTSTLTGGDSGTVGTTSTAESTATSNAKSRAVNSDFPQTMLSENGDYASSASDSVGENDSSSTSESQDNKVSESSTNRESVDNTVSESSTNRDSELKIVSEGMSASPSTLLLEFRETILNVDLMVINELSDLFMGIWNTGDEYGSYVNYMYPLGYLGGTY